MVNWAELPPELLVSISHRLGNGGDALDVTRVRSVCRSWRISVPIRRSPKLQVRFPVWVSPTDLAHGNVPPGHFRLTQSRIYVVEQVANNQHPSSPLELTRWLVKLQEVTPGKMRVSPLLANYRICQPPEMFPKVMDLSNLRVSLISRGYDLKYTPEKCVTLCFSGDYYSLDAEKVVVSSDGGVDSAVMAIHSGGKLAFLRAGDKKWTVPDGILTRYQDVISYKNGFCLIDWLGKTIIFDSRFHTSELEQVSGQGDKKHLVESKTTGDLLLVDKYMKDVWGEDFTTITVQLRVYRLNKEMQRWEELESLGNEALFLGDDCAFSLVAQDLPGLKGNCIFFKDQRFCRDNNNSDALRWFLSDDIGVFNLEDKSIRPLAAYTDICSLFWPPSDIGLQALLPRSTANLLL